MSKFIAIRHSMENTVIIVCEDEFVVVLGPCSFDYKLTCNCDRRMECIEIIGLIHRHCIAISFGSVHTGVYI